MTDAPLVVLDACVLVNFSLCDTLLRLAEPPRLYEPKWSEQIIAETIRTLESKLDWPRSLTDYLQSELRAHFSDAWVSGYESLIPTMTNEEKDRHVLAAAVHGGAPIIVTFNLRHFPVEHVSCWGVTWLPQSWKHRLPIGAGVFRNCSTSCVRLCPVLWRWFRAFRRGENNRLPARRHHAKMEP